jgi:hypothetical protein
MGDTPDTAQRLAFARGRIMFGSTVDPVEARFLFDRIDTLTAKLAEVEAERDALRVAVAILAGKVETLSAERAVLWASLRPLPDDSPSPVEGGQ